MIKDERAFESQKHKIRDLSPLKVSSERYFKTKPNL
jgi:hypothetical protein